MRNVSQKSRYAQIKLTGSWFSTSADVILQYPAAGRSNAGNLTPLPTSSKVDNSNRMTSNLSIGFSIGTASSSFGDDVCCIGSTRFLFVPATFSIDTLVYNYRLLYRFVEFLVGDHGVLLRKYIPEP